jgi:hypothetical protein
MKQIIVPLFNFDRENESSLNLDATSKIVPLKLRNSPDVKYAIVIDVEEKNQQRTALNKVLTIFKLFKDDIVICNTIMEEDGKIDTLPHTSTGLTNLEVSQYITFRKKKRIISVLIGKNIP